MYRYEPKEALIRLKRTMYNYQLEFLYKSRLYAFSVFMVAGVGHTTHDWKFMLALYSFSFQSKVSRCRMLVLSELGMWLKDIIVSWMMMS